MSVPEKWKDLAHAWVDGAAIEVRHRAIRLEWGNVDFPAWSEDFEYRIKPKAKVKKWRWVYRDRAFAALNVTSDFYSESEASCRCYVQKIDSTMIEVDE